VFGIAALLAAAMWIQSAYAYTECAVTISQIYSGDDGNLWFVFAGGGSAVMFSTDPDRQATLSLAMTALVTSRPVSVRYTANSVACTSAGRTDLIGFWLQ